MHEVIKNYIAEKEKEQRLKLEKEKKEFLQSEELFEKVYSEQNEYSYKFPFSEVDENGQVKYYKEVPIEITDEEYLELKKSAQKRIIPK